MKEKGIEEFLSAVKLVRDKYPNTQFHICGFCEETYEISKSKFISIIDSFKTKKERINEQLKTIQKDITENLKNINFKMKGKDKYGK